MRSLKHLLPLISLAITFFMFVPQSAFADGTDNMSGWAWSSNIGWISLNNTNTGGSINYGVNENFTTGALTGYAWSSNIGWIKFGGLSSFPSGTGTTAANATVSGGNVTGWARACAGTAPGDCSSMTSRTDGWDGWISLSGTASGGYRVTLSGSGFSGYAWGGSVIGWINFNPSTGSMSPAPVTGVDGCTSSTDCGVVVVLPTTPDFTLTCENPSIAVSSTQTYFNEPIQANPTGGFINTITVSPGSSSLPNGTTYTITPSAPTINCSTGTCPVLSTLTVELNKALPANGDSYSININGTYSVDSHSCTINLQAPAVPSNGPLYKEI